MTTRNAIETLRTLSEGVTSDRYSYADISRIVRLIGVQHTRHEARAIADEFLGVASAVTTTKAAQLTRIERRISERKESWQRCQF